MTTTFIAKVAKNSYRILTGPDSSWRLGTSLALDPSRHGNPLLNQVAHQSPHISDTKGLGFAVGVPDLSSTSRNIRRPQRRPRKSRRPREDPRRQQVAPEHPRRPQDTAEGTPEDPRRPQETPKLHFSIVSFRGETKCLPNARFSSRTKGNNTKMT